VLLDRRAAAVHALLAAGADDARAAVLAVAAGADLTRRAGLVLATGLDTVTERRAARRGVASEPGVAGPALVAARWLAGAALPHLVVGTGDAGARRHAVTEPAGLPVRAHDAVAAAHAGPVLTDLARAAGRLADAEAILAQAVARVAAQADGTGK